MKVTLIWTAILGMMVIAIVGCGSDDSPTKEEMSQPATESPNLYITPVLGDWHLQTINWFENGVQTQNTDFSLALFTVTFRPDKTFDVIYRYPIEEVADQAFLEWKRLEHIQEIVVTFLGTYGIDEKQLRFYVDRTRVEPKEAPEIDADFENPIFFYHIGLERGQETRSMDYSLVNNGNQLELVAKQGKNHANFIHHRIKLQ